MKYTSKSEYILGIAVSTRMVEAVLVHDDAAGPTIIRTFQRKRSGLETTEPLIPEVTDDTGADVSFSTGESAGFDSALFLASEFGSVEDSEDGEQTDFGKTPQFALPCDHEIQDIVSECADAGYENVNIVFALPSDFVGANLISISENPVEDGKRSKKKKQDKSELMFAELQEAFGGELNEKTVSYIPVESMTGGQETYLGVFPLSSEPVSISLEAIRDRKRPFPSVSLLDNEITLLMGLARASLLTDGQTGYDAIADADEEPETSVIVRVGADDTMVIFMSGQELTHFESLRSITAYDPADTITSRILLMHDEFGEGDAERMFLFREESETAVFSRLTQVFPDTHIVRLKDVLPPMEEEMEESTSLEFVIAVAATLRRVRDELWQTVFPEVNFLDPKLRGRKFTLPFSWPVAAMIIVLFATTLFFVHRYFTQSHAIEMTRYELKNFPDDTISEDADVLQAKIDSLRNRSTGIIDALDVLDSLLIGSDVWSRALERTSVNTGDISGLWIERWAESEDGTLSMTGTSMDRDQIVEFASRASANIESISFSEIRDWPVYSFTMTMRLTRELPEAALYLREEVMRRPRRTPPSVTGLDQAEVASETEVGR